MLRVLLPVRAPLALLLATLTLVVAIPAHAGLLRDGLRMAPADALPTDRIIVKWREDGVAALRIDDPIERTARLINSTGLSLRSVRALGARLDVIRLTDAGANTQRERRAALEAALTQLRFDPSVEYAEADERIYIYAAPNDPRFVAGSDVNGSWGGQWYLNAPNTTTPAAIGAVTAWDLARGAGVNVAVIDTGIRLDHPDLAGKLLAGWDLVCHDNLNLACTATGSRFLVANDGDGWDADSSDPGDGITAADLALSGNPFKGCGSGANGDQPLESSWHGTRVAGFIGAVKDNGIGIAGAAPDAKIMPVRAIGKCTGYTSDLVAAMFWAAGINDSALGTLPPATGTGVAQVINLSLGNRQDCSAAEQAAIDAVIAKGIVVVAAAGNDGGPIGSPANCKGVLSVAGLRHIGTKVGYSNVSSTAAAVGIAAPAGNCVNTAPGSPCLYSLDTLSNTGHFAPDPPSATDRDFAYT
jgi:serine protease